MAQVNIILKAVNRTGAVIASVAKDLGTLQAAAVGFNTSTRGAATATGNLSRNFGRLSGNLASTHANFQLLGGAAVPTLQGVAGAAEQTGQTLRGLGRQAGDGLGRVGRAAAQAGEKVGLLQNIAIGATRALQFFAADATFRILGFIPASIAVAGNMQALRTSLTGVAGSAELAGERIQELRNLAELPGVDFSNAARLSVLFQSLGIEVADVNNLLVELGNLIALEGGGRVELEGIGRGFRQLISLQRINQEELNQILERSPRFAGSLQRVFGTVRAENISEEVGQGFENIIERFIRPVLQDLQQGTRADSNSFNNIVSNFGNAINRFQEVLGNNLLPAATDLIAAATALADVARSAAGGGGPSVLASGARAVPRTVLAGRVALQVPRAVSAIALTGRLGGGGLRVAEQLLRIGEVIRPVIAAANTLGRTLRFLGRTLGRVAAGFQAFFGILDLAHLVNLNRQFDETAGTFDRFIASLSNTRSLSEANDIISQQVRGLRALSDQYREFLDLDVGDAIQDDGTFARLGAGISRVFTGSNSYEDITRRDQLRVIEPLINRLESLEGGLGGGGDDPDVIRSRQQAIVQEINNLNSALGTQQTVVKAAREEIGLLNNSYGGPGGGSSPLTQQTKDLNTTLDSQEGTAKATREEIASLRREYGAWEDVLGNIIKTLGETETAEGRQGLNYAERTEKIKELNTELDSFNELVSAGLSGLSSQDLSFEGIDAAASQLIDFSTAVQSIRTGIGRLENPFADIRDVLTDIRPQRLNDLLDISDAILRARQRVIDQITELRTSEVRADLALLEAAQIRIDASLERSQSIVGDAVSAISAALSFEQDIASGITEQLSQQFREVGPGRRGADAIIEELNSINDDIISGINEQERISLSGIDAGATPEVRTTSELSIRARFGRLREQQEEELQRRILEIRQRATDATRGQDQIRLNSILSRAQAELSGTERTEENRTRIAEAGEDVRLALIAASENRVNDIRRNGALQAEQIAQQTLLERSNLSQSIIDLARRVQDQLTDIDERGEEERLDNARRAEAILSGIRQDAIRNQLGNVNIGFFGQNAASGLREQIGLIRQLSQEQIGAIPTDTDPGIRAAEIQRITAEAARAIGQTTQDIQGEVPRITAHLTRVAQSFGTTIFDQFVILPGQVNQQLEDLDRETQSQVDRVRRDAELKEEEQEERITEIKRRAVERREDIERSADARRVNSFKSIGIQFASSLVSELIEWGAYQASKALIARVTNETIASSNLLATGLGVLGGGAGSAGVAAGGAGLAGLGSTGAALGGIGAFITPLLPIIATALIANQLTDGALFHDPVSDRRARNLGADIQNTIAQNNRVSASDFIDNVSAGVDGSSGSGSGGASASREPIQIYIENPINLDGAEFAKQFNSILINLQDQHRAVRVNT